MTRRTQRYHDYTLEVTTFELRDGGYTAHYVLSKHEGPYVDETPFESGMIFASDDEAHDEGLKLAKQMVDSGFRPTKIVTNRLV